ncbi:low affinity immunoglobulin gamma Fc region receptor II-b-like [Acanthochromis polyacanthus]|uniref:low affinity immunoglobulin gamma Fc region receptor II-b-like n=1 Tax=Acanthochromis polyacanthus TaxID=80966 RepID=UPI002234D5A2|nr:low affinity immunoglobulin gamma Fc region receptor II-b-like [Acanthochromis polyacanthus]
MEITTLCAVMASLRVLPDRSQFFQYESVSLSCEQHGNSSGWTVMRNTSTQINEKCPTLWEKRNESDCIIDDLLALDSGVYWCESGAGECSNTVYITVTAASVILESPVLPVMEGEVVNFRCSDEMTSSNLTAGFYKDNLLIGSSSTGNFTIESVSKSDEGLYKCNISGVGESTESWLTVRGLPESPSTASTLILLPVVGVYLSLVSVMLFCLCRSHKVTLLLTA